MLFFTLKALIKVGHLGWCTAKYYTVHDKMNQHHQNRLLIIILQSEKRTIVYLSKK